MKIVQKYGGSSLADENCLRRVAARIAADAVNNKLVAVVSAQGKTTDALTAKYMEISSQFPSRESDRLLVTGEQISASLLAATLNGMGVSAVSFDSASVPIFADGNYGNGEITRIGTFAIKKAWRENKVVVVTGFQGVTKSGDYITLGRGGSDTSAVALAAALKADKCMIFTDVDGIYSADPRKVQNAKHFEDIHIDSMLCLAQNGAKVLHPKSVALAKKYNTPLWVLSTFSDSFGTSVSAVGKKRNGITLRQDGAMAVITLVFTQEDSDVLQNILVSLCENSGFLFERFPSYFRLSVPSEVGEEWLLRLHGILYPSAEC